MPLGCTRTMATMNRRLSRPRRPASDGLPRTESYWTLCASTWIRVERNRQIRTRGWDVIGENLRECIPLGAQFCSRVTSLQYYWPKEHCIQQEPLHLDADTWELCQQYPALYSLVLIDVNGAPIPIPGSQLVEMRKQERLILYPATYKLEYRSEDSQ